ncbi:hypothetical protein LR48_Vigan08g093000 [Vigna angularis]|uniref:MINDY deubiquitinase domain-containing protein n=1 Tax=Phaseolus angularis TaxID=3914 RepID=A0A0L9V576_PHAAN|nr:hypothetical protein LR48_Vigan08g093000 [Vigna angularis]
MTGYYDRVFILKLFSLYPQYAGELYLLAIDQGYINQPDLVWEKLNEVNGDSLFMTSNFKEFKVENHENSTWDEKNALTSTTEFEQQPSRQNYLQQSSNSGNSRLVTGPRNICLYYN